VALKDLSSTDLDATALRYRSKKIRMLSDLIRQVRP